MSEVIDFIFNPRTVLVIGGFITTLSTLIIGLSKKGKTSKFLIWFMFVGGILVIIGGFKADIDQENSTKSIIQKTETISNLSTKIIKLTEENIQKAETITLLSTNIAELTETNVKESEQISNTVTGGDSYCYINFGSQGHDISRFLVHKGSYPIYNVSVRILDLNKFQLLNQKHQITQENLTKIEEYYYYDILLPGKGIQLNRLANLQNSDSLNYNIFFSARNGDWVQETRIRRVNGKWKFADRCQGMGKELLLHVSKDFPLNADNKVNW